MELSINGRLLHFVPVALTVAVHEITSVFRGMNSRNVAGMIAKRRYRHLVEEAAQRYPGGLEDGVGQFLYRLKCEGDPFYRRFLNRYGDLTYCRFAIKEHLNSRGIYAYMRGAELVYIGRSRDPFAKRINQGYGKIDPRNCYLDGQATNCHLNALIAKDWENVSFNVFPMDSAVEIVEIERLLILKERPRWNIALAGGDPVRAYMRRRDLVKPR